MSNSSQPCPYVSHAMNWRTSVPVWTNVVESVPALGARAGLWTGAGGSRHTTGTRAETGGADVSKEKQTQGRQKLARSYIPIHEQDRPMSIHPPPLGRLVSI